MRINVQGGTNAGIKAHIPWRGKAPDFYCCGEVRKGHWTKCPECSTARPKRSN